MLASVHRLGGVGADVRGGVGSGVAGSGVGSGVAGLGTGAGLGQSSSSLQKYPSPPQQQYWSPSMDMQAEGFQPPVEPRQLPEERGRQVGGVGAGVEVISHWSPEKPVLQTHALPTEFKEPWFVSALQQL